MAAWTILGKLALLLGCASVAGVLLRRVGQNAVVGYLLTGLILGPSGFDILNNPAELRTISELGVALLLFSIGTEFSVRRLSEFGRIATIGGFLQVVATSSILGGLGVLAGIPVSESMFLAFALSMSSTAVVLRVLMDRAELDSPHGRNAIGLLLFQDLAVVPLVLVTDAAGPSVGPSVFSGPPGLRVLALLGFGGVLWIAMKLVLPRVLAGAASSGSRELPVLAAACIAIFSSWGAHTLGVSPALGAFLAGIILGESMFATQVRADLTPLSSVFVTVFFASIGTLVEIPLGLGTAIVIASAVVVVMVKFAVVGAIVWSFQRSLRVAVSSGLAMAQAGEFSFVLADQASSLQIIHGDRFKLFLAVSLVTLTITPYLIGIGPTLAVRLIRRVPVRYRADLEMRPRVQDRKRVVLIGFGPAGQRVAESLRECDVPFIVLDMNPQTVAAYRSALPIELGDATQLDVLRHAGVARAQAVVITAPDPWTGALIVAQVKRVGPLVPVVARARYHRYAEELKAVGAEAVVDEEDSVGDKLAGEVRDLLRRRIGEPAGN